MNSTSIARLFRAELTRIAKLPGLYTAIGISSILNLGSFSRSMNAEMPFSVQSAAIATSLLEITLLVWASQYGASAYDSGSITRFVFIAGKKQQALLIRFAVVAVATAFAILATFILALIGGLILGAATQTPFEFGEILWLEDLRIIAVVFWLSLLGFFAGLVARNKALASAGSLGLLLVPAVTLVLTAPELVQYMPLEIAARFVAGPDATIQGSVSFAQASLTLVISLVLFGASGWLRAISRKTKRLL